MVNFVAAVNIFSVPFIATLLILLVAVFVVTFLIRKILKTKYIKELELSKVAYEELSDKLFSKEWEQLKEISKHDREISELLKQKHIESRFNSLSEMLMGCNSIILSLNEQALDDYDLRDVTSVLAYINEIIENESEKIYALNNDVEGILIQSKYPKQDIKKVTSPVNTIDDTPKEKEVVKEVSPVTSFANRKYKPTMVKEIKKEKVVSDREERKMDYNNDLNNENVNDNNANMGHTTSSSEEYSVFGNGLVIDGNVSVETPLIVRGEIRGNLTCGKSVEFDENALVTGDVTAQSLNLHSGKVVGNINVNNDVYIGEDTFVKGNVQARAMEINGSIEGNVTAKADISFSSQAMILGDISAVYIDIEKGAKISGTMKIGEGNSTTDSVSE
ncbi:MULTISPECIES: polymer-forming cytoskeletal protein [unclassified Breznakia]|uniref:polymer-forming cytoskeletal protein n=1 Tax=unclassified Breznakia TaxID=2623764 RepID=UPI00240748F1|nr:MULTISPECIES: polymer-forming cytoskeletal protein [unclassified Breznakia]MDF9837803.1 cytoskeletal protein CcmA (bactofilin family) [Breznakia sp. PFB2-8]MDF9859723.1 cytoskeletal protein CcmA (bactofilin family) [Breznakia sp. PH5-24]